MKEGQHKEEGKKKEEEEEIGIEERHKLARERQVNGRAQWEPLYPV